MSDFITAFIASFLFFLIIFPVFLGILRIFGFYTIVNEREAHVFVLFGNIVGEIKEPGIHFLWFKFGLRALFVNILGRRYKINLRLDQTYLRSQPVNSEEGAPMGIGIWYEMYIDNAQAYIFRNTDPRGSLAANVGNSTVRCLSNLPLDRMMNDRHAMSKTVRKEVSPNSKEWGYVLGSCYIRKVHFRDHDMIKQIESKVVNRLRQVTSAIKQDGTNQVSVIHNTAERKAAIAFGEAAAVRPKIVGEALKNISSDDDVIESLFEILETEKVLNGKIPIQIIPKNNELLSQMLAKDFNDNN